MPASAEQIRDQVAKIAGHSGGATARELVSTVSTEAKVETVAVQRVLRSMLEKGEVVVDSDMHLTLRK